MSKHINVNPGQYKVGGREHIGNAVAKAPQPDAVNREPKPRVHTASKKRSKGQK
jgi:hypothetical protein